MDPTRPSKTIQLRKDLQLLKKDLHKYDVALRYLKHPKSEYFLVQAWKVIKRDINTLKLQLGILNGQSNSQEGLKGDLKCH